MYCGVFMKSPLGQLPSDLKWTEAVTNIYATTTKGQVRLVESLKNLPPFCGYVYLENEILMDF